MAAIDTVFNNNKSDKKAFRKDDIGRLRLHSAAAV